MTSGKILSLLRRFESRNILHAEPDGSWPIVWKSARGVQVVDMENRRYLDLTAAFGVAAAGHANPRVVRAGQRQMTRLLHAMGDVHPHALKAELARELSRLTFERWRRPTASAGQEASIPRHGKSIFCNSGFEAVEAALKTAMLATGKAGVIAFTGAYHGTGYGTLNATHRAHFHAPFKTQLATFGHFVKFPAAVGISTAGKFPGHDAENARKEIERIVRRHEIGAVLVEPVQARGGIIVPEAGFLHGLREQCDRHGLLLIVDEIFTGFGRTGKWFACEHSPGAIPDLICLGKALTGGFPLSACVGRADVMDRAWPESSGEAIHTSTYLGHPVGCAMALAQIAEIRRLKLVEQSARIGRWLLRELGSQSAHLKVEIVVRGLGLMAGLELLRPDGSPATREALTVVKEMLRRGFILLPEGEHGNVISFTPPLTITEDQLRGAVKPLFEELRRLE
ncbi:MAG: hypothetical protein QOF48_3395 [Verrucomicrobiota bacterium]|jgi:4-aminobutyrate aminotransferase-like enzyme